MINKNKIKKHTVYNIIGQAAPLVVAFFSIPLLIKGLGTARFGVLTLEWMVIGYFSFFDMGIGRALTKMTAEKIGCGEIADIPLLVWSGMMLMLGLGMTGVIITIVLTPFLATKLLNIPTNLTTESISALYWLSFSLPAVIGTAGLKGVLEAYQKFGLVNLLRIPIGLLTFLAPLFVLPFSHSLVPITAVLAIGRFVAFGAHVKACFHTVTGLGSSFKFDKSQVRKLLTFGGWMTITNIIGPLLVYLDRFLIGMVLSVSFVAYYATPYEMVTKLWIFPTALLGVVFPAFSAFFASDRNEAGRLLCQSVNTILFIMFPLSFVIITFAPEFLNFWLGTEFSRHSTTVLQWLTVGVLLNSLGQVPYAFIQGGGRPDITARLHLVELPFYILLLWLMLRFYSIEGAAISWTARIAIDSGLMFYSAFKMLDFSFSVKTIAFNTICLTVISIIPIFMFDFGLRVTFVISTAIILLATTVFKMIMNKKTMPGLLGMENGSREKVI